MSYFEAIKWIRGERITDLSEIADALDVTLDTARKYRRRAQFQPRHRWFRGQCKACYDFRARCERPGGHRGVHLGNDEEGRLIYW